VRKPLTGEIPLMSRDTEMDWILAKLKRPEPSAFVLAAAGASSREIAAKLVLSVRTVDNHLQNAYSKLGVTSREELARVLRS
jgi:DNA-binding NarL/FixJ family response regulator